MSQHQQIIDRLSRLERANRRLKFAAVAGVGLALGLFFIGAEARQQELTVERLRVVDADGKLRAAIGGDKDGSFIILNDQTGKLRASMAAQKSGSWINIKDDTGRTRVLMSYDDEGAVVRTTDDRGLFSKIVTDDHGAALQVGQENGRVRIIAPMIDLLQEPQKDDKNPAK